MTPTEVLTAITGALAVKFPALTVEAHGGRFTERELALTLAKAPALLLGCVGFPKIQMAGPDRWRAELKWTLYVLGADSATIDRDTLALNTVFALMTWLPEQKWGLAGALLPDQASLSADNLYSGQVNLLRVSVWGVTWAQSFLLTA